MTLTDREYQRLRDVSIDGDPRGGRGHRRLQHPVRGATRPTGRRRRHRDEPARLTVLGAGVEGDRVPDREDRREVSRSATPWTRSATTSPCRRRRRSSRRWTTSSSRCRASRSRSSPRPTPSLTTTMKSVGEAMAIGRCFTEALQKALRSLETTAGSGFHWDGARARRSDGAVGWSRPLRSPYRRPRGTPPQQALRLRAPVSRTSARGHGLSTRGSSTRSPAAGGAGLPEMRRGGRRWTPALLRRGQARTACRTDSSQRCAPSSAAGRAGRWPRRTSVRGLRHALGVRPVYKTVDTCAAEFAASHPVPLLQPTTPTRTRSRRSPRRRTGRKVRDPRLGAEPDRAGRRVRLLLRARRVRAVATPGSRR